MAAERRWDQLEADPQLAGPWHQLFKQVQSPRHVLSELLQNADDAEATQASAHVENDTFTFTHNGCDFHEDHFNSICQFGYSNKRNLHTIGFRGIGFKSTFSLGDVVSLDTPTLSVDFYRERFTEPAWVGRRARRDTRVSVESADRHRLKELQTNLDEWCRSPLSLLFFTHLETLRIGGTVINRETIEPGPVDGSEWVRLTGAGDAKLLHIRSDPEEFPEDCKQEIEQERMGTENLDLPPCSIDIILGHPGSQKLYVVLPTGVETDLPFCVNGPFVQDPARVKIKDPGTSPTNRWLLERAGTTAAETMKAWLGHKKLALSDRAGAYGLLPAVDEEEDSLESSCTAVCCRAFGEAIQDQSVVLTEKGEVEASAFTVPSPLAEVWEPEALMETFEPAGSGLLARAVAAPHSERLAYWELVTDYTTYDALANLKSCAFPRPKTWGLLLLLWHFVADHTHSWQGDQDEYHIVPVQGADDLLPARHVTRLGRERLLDSEEDWRFLSRHLSVLNPNWVRFLSDQRRRLEGENDSQDLEQVEIAIELMGDIGLAEASNIDTVVAQVSASFFGDEECEIEDAIRIAHIAAALGATVPDSFEYVTRSCDRLKPKQAVVADIEGDLDLFVNAEWLEEHALHEDYGDPRSCSLSEWESWLKSDRSRLFTFVLPKSSARHYWSKNKLEAALRERGLQKMPYYHYNWEDYSLLDYDYPEGQWEGWEEASADNEGYWGRIFDRILSQPERFWSETRSAQLTQTARNGRGRTGMLTASWILRFRELPCLPDNRGTYRVPAELMLRTAETEGLIGVEPFVDARLDTERLRSLHLVLGCRNTPTGYNKVLDRLRAMAAITPIRIDETAKWCRMIDAITEHASTEQLTGIKTAFLIEKLIPTDKETWTTSTGVFLSAGDSEIQDIDLVHPAVRHLSLWQKIEVAVEPSTDRLLDWLRSLREGEKLEPDTRRKVRALLSRYGAHVWEECEGWLNLDSEWVEVGGLQYKQTMQALYPSSRLFPGVRKQTADLQMLAAQTCDSSPFDGLSLLTEVIEDRADLNLSRVSGSEERAWITDLGDGLSRVKLTDAEATKRVRTEAGRLRMTTWHGVNGLKSVPYLEGTPAGAAYEVTVLWLEDALYCAELPMGKLHAHISRELSRPFQESDVGEAVKACVDRSTEFIAEYLESAFDLEEVVWETDTAASTNDAPVTDPDSGTPGFEASEPGVNAEPTEEDGEAESDDVEADEDEPLTADSEGGNGRPTNTRPRQPSLIEVFAEKEGFGRADPHQFRHSDGRVLRREDGAFPWRIYDADGEFVLALATVSDSLANGFITVDAEIWQMCQRAPAQYGIVCREGRRDVIAYTGEELTGAVEEGRLEVLPAAYRLKHVVQV